MAAALPPVESLLSPLAEDAPAGPNLEYDPDFLALTRAVAGKPEVQYGDNPIEGEPPDWAGANELALALAGRTRDLRVAVWLLRCQARLAGLEGAAWALQLVHGLLQQQWDHVHPQLDADDHNDPTMRLTALDALYRAEAVPADLRAARLASVRGSLTLREVELALGKADTHPGESAPTEEGVLQALTALLATAPGLAQTVAQAEATARAIGTLLDEKLGSAVAPDDRPLTSLLRLAAGAVARCMAPAEAEPQGMGATPDTVVRAADVDSGSAGFGGSLATREDAVRQLERVCAWIERHEPTNPAPLLIRRAQRLMNKNFMDIIRDIAPDGLSQIERLAGPDAQN